MTLHDWVILQQWDAGRRCLMIINPQFGIGANGVHTGVIDSGLREGWNLVREGSTKSELSYIRIGEKDGEYLSNPPFISRPQNVNVVEYKIHELSASRLWSVFRSRSINLCAQGILNYDEIEKISSAIYNASKELFDIMGLWKEGIALMKSAIDGIARNDSVVSESLLDLPILQLINKYLSLEIPGSIAADLMGDFLSAECTIPNLWPPLIMEPELRVAVIEHLADTVWSLLASREKMEILSYYEITYLAGLYACAGLRICEWGRLSGNHSPKEVDRMGKLSLNLEETLAHRIFPVYVLPSTMTPAEIVVALINRAKAWKRSLESELDYYQIHPALTSVAVEFQLEKLNIGEINAQFKSRSDALEKFDVGVGGASPFSVESREKIRFDLLTILFGRGRVPNAEKSV